MRFRETGQTPSVYYYTMLIYYSRFTPMMVNPKTQQIFYVAD